jgi:hypothetical protein
MGRKIKINYKQLDFSQNIAKNRPAYYSSFL